MERKSGFYWVKFYEKDNWTVIFYSGKRKFWIISGNEYEDEDFEVINENRIMSPDEWE